MLPFQTIIPLANLPSIRVLVLVQGMYRIRVAVKDETIKQCAVNYFTQLPTLEYIILRYLNPHEKEYHYTKLSILSCSENILQDELTIHYDLAAPWWTFYNI